MNDLAERAFREHYANVVAFLRRRTGSSEEAEELAQTVFVQAAERLTPNGHAPVPAWLYTVARRRLIDEARKRSRRASVALDAQPPRASEPQYGSEVATALRRALELLSPPQRTIVVGRLIEGRSFAELAASLEISEAACKMRFVRGLQSVRALFEEEGIEP